MAILKPFAALLPNPGLAAQICELPYDVMSSEEAREIAAENQLSFLHVSKPELLTDIRQHFYLYRQIMGSHSQVGLVAAASCDEYEKNLIKKHEFTRPDKEDDRVRHIETLNAQTGPVFLTYRAEPTFDAFVAKKILEMPRVDFTAKDGVRHTAWTISDAGEINLIETQFARIPFLYIADGHHRSAAAWRVFKSRQAAGESARFLAVIFPHNQMQILPYNRVLKDLNGFTPAQILDHLRTVFAINAAVGRPKPVRKHEVSLYLGRKWYSMTFRENLTTAENPVDRLDVTLLQQHVLPPVFGIEDPRTSKKINFVGGIRGPAELERLVDSGEYACAFSMFPTSIEDLMTIADGGGIMPPKSTWFEPKLRDAMFCHLI
jgi:uncharacterized protein (DUF1015 family)